MQAASSIYYLPSSHFFSCYCSTKTASNRLFHKRNKRSFISMKASSSLSSSDAPQVDYSSMASSVFPAEACDTLGGVACDVEMFPETKLKHEEPNPKVKVTSESGVDREYLEYDDSKTVFIAEACDDLGGEFCEAPYQSGSN